MRWKRQFLQDSQKYNFTPVNIVLRLEPYIVYYSFTSNKKEKWKDKKQHYETVAYSISSSPSPSLSSSSSSSSSSSYSSSSSSTSSFSPPLLLVIVVVVLLDSFMWVSYCLEWSKPTILVYYATSNYRISFD